MSKEKFKVFNGAFPCHTCKEEVSNVRLWLDTANLTWMCSQKHLTKVPLILTKKDYEREK
jgi:hypothetical protein